MTETPITSKQAKQFKRFVEDAADRALQEVELDKDALQRLLSRGGEFQAAVVGSIRTFSAKPPEKLKLLDLLETVELPALGEFKAAEKFIINTQANARVKIGWLGSNFQTHLNQKVEAPIGEAKVKISRLRRDSRDHPIIDEVGGEERVEITLGQFYELLACKQARGDLTSTTVYIRDGQGTLWTVDANWRSVGNFWSVEAYLVGYPNRCYADLHVVSH